ncbi:hypothetical protein R1sor_024433 [Riccia sorocarpa]|uniref:Uncharacterized protein n=1 Tax=Riccia sorocarpa TaxID=122646 RepID=A0ABD3GSQ9_9MARC
MVSSPTQDLTKLGYNSSLPSPINLAIQATMAAIQSKPVHALIQQLDLAAVETNREEARESEQLEAENHAALLIESLGIHHWVNIHHTYSTKGEEATLGLIRQLHDDLPNLLEADLIEDGRADKLSGMIARALSWVDLLKNTQTGDGTDGPGSNFADISSQVRSNPLIDFTIFSEEEKACLDEGLDSLNSNAAGDKAAVSNDGDPFIPTDTPRTVEYRVSEKCGMMWKCQNMNNLAPVTIDMWSKMVNMTDNELSTCKDNAINGIIPSKVIPIRESIKMASFRDKYTCTEPVSVRIKVNLITDSNRVSKHRTLLWNWTRPYLRCNCKFDSKGRKCKGEIIWLDHALWYIFNHMEDFFRSPTIQARYMAFLIFLGGEARAAILAQCSFMYARELMIQTALEVFSDPKARSLPEHGEANGVRMIERLIKPACFSDQLISNQLQGNQRKRPRQANNINLNSAPTRLVPMGRGQRMRGGRHYNGNRPYHHTPGSSSSSSRTFSSG